LDQITPAWLDQVFAASIGPGLPKVSGIGIVVIGEEIGFLSQVARIDLTFDGDTADLPDTIVVKMEPDSGEFVSTSKEVRAFEREVLFYKEIAPTLGMRLPRIFFAEATETASLLVMEDLSAMTRFDQVRGLSHDHVLAAVREIAKLHAAHWNNQDLKSKPWLPVHDHFFDDGYHELWPPFAEAYGLRIGREARYLGERVAKHLRWIEERIDERPLTLIHGDFRADNILFDVTGAAADALVLDWQLGNLSMATIDVARLLGGSEPIAERKGHQFEILEAWHGALVDEGVDDYHYEDALYDLRLGALYSLFIPVKVLHLAGNDPGPRAARLLDATAQRQFASALELGAGQLLPD
jgi:thiamine kinase-like enzyme